MTNFFKILWKAIKGFLDDDPMTYAASLAFYTVASLPAILLIAVNILSQTYDRESIETDLLAQLNRYLGPSTVDQAEAILENASATSSGFIPQIIGWGVLLVSATTVFISLQNGINRIWKVTADASAGWFQLFIDRVLSFAMIVSIGFVLLVSLILDSLITLFREWIEAYYEEMGTILAFVGDSLISVLVTSSVFILIFKVLPDVKTQWKNVWVGGVLTSFLFLVGKVLIGIYITSADVGNAYGASGSLVVFLFWVYYSSSLVLFGAKFTYEYTKFNQSKLEASEHAAFVKEELLPDSIVPTSKLK